MPTMSAEEREDDGGGDTGPDDPHAAAPRIIPVTAMANSAGRTWDDFGGCKRMLGPPQGDTSTTAEPIPPEAPVTSTSLIIIPSGRGFANAD